MKNKSDGNWKRKKEESICLRFGLQALIGPNTRRKVNSSFIFVDADPNNVQPDSTDWEIGKYERAPSENYINNSIIPIVKLISSFPSS